MTAALRIQGLAKSFGPVRALAGVSFDVPAQSVFGLLGPNGAGKTTLFSVAAGFLKPNAGTVEALGIDSQRTSELQGRLTILPQDALFQRNVPIIDQLVFFLRLAGRTPADAEREVKRSLERVGLGEYMNRRVYALSHGMIKRLGLAQAFLGEPEVILLDEPTSGLDPQNARQVRDLVREFRQRATVVISSHNLAEIQDLCDHVAILDEGHLVTAGSVEEIVRAGKRLDMILSRAVVEEERKRLLELPGVCEVNEWPGGRTIFSLDLAAEDLEADAVTSAILRALLDMGITPRRLFEGSSLEDVFLKLTGGGEP